MRSIAGKYAKGQGVKTAPTGFQNAVEPVITFVRDEVARRIWGTGMRNTCPFY